MILPFNPGKLWLALMITAMTTTGPALLSQVKPHRWPGDTIGPFTTITFEDTNTRYISIAQGAQNIWQIAAPSKPYFSQAYTPPNAILTDSAAFYPVSNTSSFDLIIGEFNMGGTFGGWYPWNIFVDFRHKFDTDTLQDGGFISVSWDHGQTWMNIVDDTISKQMFTVSPAQPDWSYFGNTNIYGHSDSLFNGEPGFSGHSYGWVQTCMAWYDIPVRHPSFAPTDTMMLRFTFISDNVTNNKEGWMIDQIRLFSIDLGGGLEDLRSGTHRFFMAPNPVREEAMVIMDKIYHDVGVRVTDLSGKIIRQTRISNCRQFSLNTASLPPGTYLVSLTFDDGQMESRKLVRRNSD